METRANHLLIGSFTLLALALAVAFGLWIARYTTEGAWNDFEIRFSQAVTGLSVGGSVQYNGIHVGTVRELSLAADDPRQVIARIRIRADAPVKEDTVARLGLTGLTGVAFIQLSGGSPESPTLTAGPDQDLPRIPAEESRLQRLIESSEDIAETANEALLRVLDFLSEDNAERLANTLANIDLMVATVTAEDERFVELIRNAHQASVNLDDLLGTVNRVALRLETSIERIDEQLVAQLPGLTEDVGVGLSQLVSTLARIDDVLAENEDALAGFAADGLSQLGPTLAELRMLMRDLSRVSARLERNPRRFLFGGERTEEYQPQ